MTAGVTEVLASVAFPDMAVRALAAFVRFREAPALTLRRAAAATALASVEAWRHVRLRQRAGITHAGLARPTSALQALTQLTLLPSGDGGGGGGGGGEGAALDQLVTECVDWCVGRADAEHSADLRAVYSQLVAYALEVLAGSGGLS